METGWPIESLLLFNISQNENVHNCSKWISRETSTLQDLPELLTGFVFPNDLSHFKLLLKPFPFLVLICLRSTTVEPTFLKTNFRQLSHGRASL